MRGYANVTFYLDNLGELPASPAKDLEASSGNTPILTASRDSGGVLLLLTYSDDLVLFGLQLGTLAN